MMFKWLQRFLFSMMAIFYFVGVGAVEQALVKQLHFASSCLAVSTAGQTKQVIRLLQQLLADVVVAVDVFLSFSWQ